MTECLVSVQELINSVKLKLNSDKAEFSIIGNTHTKETLIPNCPVTLLQSSMMLAEEVKILTQETLFTAM